MIIFEALSKLEKKIRLTAFQWAHMRFKHPELSSQENKMIETLKNPDLIYHSPQEENFQYLKLFGQTPLGEKYLLLIVKHLNGEGFIITGFFVSKIKTKDKVLIWKRK